MTNKTYDPRPLDLSAIELPANLAPLAEAIAENVHDIWARGRMDAGWTYGPQRDDTRKTNPCLVPYSELPDSEKAYDRDTALGTLKFILANGWTIRQKDGA
jgi:ryanodine receptor 2